MCIRDSSFLPPSRSADWARNAPTLALICASLVPGYCTRTAAVHNNHTTITNIQSGRLPTSSPKLSYHQYFQCINKCITDNSNRSAGWPKNWHHFVRFNLPNINDLKNYFTVTIRRKFVIILSLEIPPHLKYVATPPYEMSSVLKATIFERLNFIKYQPIVKILQTYKNVINTIITVKNSMYWY